MKNKICIKIIFITLAFILLFSIIYKVRATFATGKYKPETIENKDDDAKVVFNIGEKAMGTIRNIAVLVAVVTIGIIGLRYMFGSVDQKAEYKATMLPWVIGLSLVAMITEILDIIQNLASKI